MKNFRKVLALVLVIATLMSFVTMASAVEYKDAADINYDAAVDVLSAIGILNGYKTGDEYSFKPEDTIEREEMAKMIAVLHNAGTDIGDLYASACTFADAKDSWAASYIAYCSQTGIVAGHNADTFAPNDNISGYAVAKMLLVTLGFDAEIQGYVGANWKVNVLRDAKNFGLLKGLAADFNIAADIKREEAAQMMFNALQAPMVVGAVSENLVKISNAWYLAGNDPELVGIRDLTLTLTDAYKAGFTVLYGNVVISTKPLGAIYKGLDVEVEDVYDCFGRPGTVWTYTTKTSSFQKFYADAADYTFTNKVDLVELLDAEADLNYDVTVFWNGYETPDLKVADLKDASTGKGLVTEVYVDDIAQEVVVVIINTYIEKVTATATYAKTFTTADGTFDNSKYGFKVDDYILYTVCNGHGAEYAYEKFCCHNEKGWRDGHEIDHPYYLHDAKVVKPTTVTVSDTFWSVDGISKSTFTADGKVYEYAHNYEKWIESPSDAADGTVTEDWNKKKINVYVDDYGYVMTWTKYEAPTETFVGYFIENTMVREKDIVNEMIDGAWVDVDAYHADVMDFTPALTEDVALKFDSTRETSLVKAMYYNWTSDFTGNGNGEQAGVLAKYKFVAGKAVPVKDGIATFLEEGGIVDTVTGKIYKADGETVEVWGNNDTKYMIRTFNYGTGKYEYNVVTGHKAIDAEYIAEIWVDGGDNGAGYLEVAALQYLDTNNDNIAEYVFLDAAFTATSETMYIWKLEGFGSCDALLPDNLRHAIPGYAVYSAFMNGEKVTVLAAASEGIKELPGLYSATALALGAKHHDGSPIYVAFGAKTVTGWNDVEKVYGGQLYINAVAGAGAQEYKNIAEDAVIVLFATGEKKIDFDGDGKNDAYAIYKGVDAFNASVYNVTEFDCGAAWADNAKTKGDITTLYLEVSLK